jgi:hypothetical protein
MSKLELAPHMTTKIRNQLLVYKKDSANNSGRSRLHEIDHTELQARGTFTQHWC